MRDILKKTTAVAMVAAAALAVSACGKSETTNVSDNVSMTDMNSGSMNDASATDMNSGGAMGDNSGMAASNDMSGSNMSDNSMMGSNTSNMQ